MITIIELFALIYWEKELSCSVVSENSVKGSMKIGELRKVCGYEGGRISAIGKSNNDHNLYV